MRANVAQFIAESAIKIGIELRLRGGYSGRGMFGRETTALQYPSEGTLLKAIVQAAADIALLEEDAKKDGDPPPCSLQDLMDDLAASRRDQMGYDEVIY